MRIKFNKVKSPQLPVQDIIPDDKLIREYEANKNYFERLRDIVITKNEDSPGYAEDMEYSFHIFERVLELHDELSRRKIKHEHPFGEIQLTLKKEYYLNED